MSFSENLRNELAYQDIQLKEFSGKIGIPYTTLLSYVGSKNCLPRIDIGLRIAEELNVSIEYLVHGNENVKYKKQTYAIANELISLPLYIQSPIIKTIHNYYEILNL